MKGRPSALPTPGRVTRPSIDPASALADAIKRNDPAKYNPTPSARPPSSASDLHPPRSSSRPFHLGDNVRIESLGFEGILRYLGEIDTKSGLWAGVELGGGFVGKGKNDGSVAGKRYFSCPDKCGVFVASTKLSAPTVGPGAVQRPSSVASSVSRGGGGGRVTPSISTGRVTPSTVMKSGKSLPMASGRITPAGRKTPSVIPETPAARAARLRALKKQEPSLPTQTPLTSKFTSGSRASKYVSMTAKQLSTLNSPSAPPTPGIIPQPSSDSPTRISRTASSPSRTGSFTTPKPRLSTNTNLVTPRPRIPSSVAMPPPASPRTSVDPASSSELEQRGKALQDKIASLSSGRQSSARGPSSPRRPSSSASVRSITSDHVDQLQARLDALEYENERLRSAADSSKEATLQLAEIEKKYTTASLRIAELEQTLNDAQASIALQRTELENATVSHKSALNELESTSKNRLGVIEEENSRLRTQLEDNQQLVDNLKMVVDEKTTTENQTDKALQARNAEWSILEARLRRVNSELEDDKRNLSAQVDELRHAGQETIALYEERLREADAQRYDLEDRIAQLEANLQAKPPPSDEDSSTTLDGVASIDNENLQDQVGHLQRKIATLEDMIEDNKLATEREEVAIRERMKRAKEKEDALKKDLHEQRTEVSRVLKLEALARDRVAEVEEALRESTVALENAQGEVEGLRGDIEHLNGLVSRTSSSGGQVEFIQALESKNLSLRQRLEEQENEIKQAHEHIESQTNELEILRKKLHASSSNGFPEGGRSASSKHDISAAREEITGLKHIIQELQKDSVASNQQNKLLESENQLLRTEVDQLRQEVRLLESNLDDNIEREVNGVDDKVNGDLDGQRRSLKEQKAKFEAEMEQLRKRLAESELKTARVTHDLNKEISELEALVESKIYREDELEQEIERLKRHKKSSKTNADVHDRDRYSQHSTNSTESATCEICEQPGHDIFTCPILKESEKSGNGVLPGDLFCEECEGHGHLAADCPHALDVF